MAGNRVISAVLTLKDKDFSTTAKKAASSTKDFERAVKHTGNSVKNFGSSAVSSFKKVAVGAGSIVTAIGAVKLLSNAFDMVRNSIGSAFDRIDVMEKFQRTMTVMTGSADKANAALETTRDAVTGTAYGLDVAAQAVQNFVTRGMNVEKATKTLAIWGDAVAFYGDGSNEQLETVSDALGKMVSSGKVNMEQMNRLFDSGIDGVGMYAKAMDLDVGNVQKMISKGMIDADEFIDVVGKAMTEGTKGVQKIAGAAKEAGASWKGSFANMRAAVTRGTESIVLNIDKMLESKGLPTMREMVADFGRKFEGVLKSAGEKVPLVGNAIMTMYEFVKPGLDWLKYVAFAGVKTAVSELGDRSLVVRDWMVGAFLAIKDRVQENSPVIDGVKNVLHDLGDKAIVVKGWLLEAFEASKPAIGWLKDEGLPLVVDGVAAVVESATSLYNYINDNWNAISPIVYGVATAIGVYKAGMAVATARTLLLTGATTVMTGVTTAMTVAQGALNAVMAMSPWGWVAIAIGLVVTAGIALYKNWDTVKEKAQSLWDKTKEVGTGIETAFKMAFGAVKLAGSMALDYVIGKVNAVIDKINNIPFVNIPNIPSVGGSAASVVGQGRGPQASYAVGTNRVPRDQVAQIHKDEMIIPARQSRNLRQQGVNIDNVDKGGPARAASQPRAVASGNSINIAKLADQIVVREEADIDKVTTMLVRKLESAQFNMA